MEREDDIMEMEVMEGQTIEIEIEEPETPIPLEWKEGKAWERGRDWLNGKDGKDGIDGKDWKDGRDWRDGIDGTDWKNGQDGKDWNSGENGKSAYEIAVDSGFEGTLEEWVQSLKWKDGKPGKNGENGRDWRPGDQGPRGVWVIGPAGPNAYQIAVNNGFVWSEAEWLASLEGTSGIDGADGVDGVDGVTPKSPGGITIDGGGSVITTGSKGYARVPNSGTITGYTLLAKESGDIIMDVKKGSFWSFPANSSITGTEKPTLSGAQTAQDMSLTTWTTAVNEGDILEFTVDSVATITRVSLFLHLTPS